MEILSIHLSLLEFYTCYISACGIGSSQYTIELHLRNNIWWVCFNGKVRNVSQENKLGLFPHTIIRLTVRVNGVRGDRISH